MLIRIKAIPFEWTPYWHHIDEGDEKEDLVINTDIIRKIHPAFGSYRHQWTVIITQEEPSKRGYLVQSSYGEFLKELKL